MSKTGLVKTGIAVVLSVVAGYAAQNATYGAIEDGKDLYHYFTDTVKVKKHFWSKPVTVYARNCQPVKQKQIKPIKVRK